MFLNPSLHYFLFAAFIFTANFLVNALLLMFSDVLSQSADFAAVLFSFALCHFKIAIFFVFLYSFVPKDRYAPVLFKPAPALQFFYLILKYFRAFSKVFK